MLRSISLGFLLCVLAAACESTPVKIRDEGAATFGGRALWRATNREETGRDWFGLELDANGVAGDDEQTLQVGDVLDLGGSSIVGPAQVSNDYELRQLTLAAVAGQEFGDQGSLRLLIGAAHQDLDLELTSGAQRIEDVDRWWGLLLGTEFLWQGGEWWGLDGRVTWAADLGDFESDMNVIELGALFAPRKALGLFAGWRWVDYERIATGESDVDLRANGPSVGLRLCF